MLLIFIFSRLLFLKHTTPNSVTKLSSTDLYFLGFESIAEAMRIVPGMITSELNATESQIGYHGLNSSIPRRMDILFNSNSIYKAGDSGIHWLRLPFSISDLESIEVVRGSSSVDFGSNAITGAVNLIQKPIALEPDFFGQVIVGSSETRKIRGGFRTSSDDHHFYMRAFAKESTGFDFARGTDKYENDYDAYGLLLSGEHSLSNNKLLDWSLSYSDYAFSFPDYSFVGNTEFAGDGASTESTQTSVRGSAPGSEVNIHNVIKLSGTNDKYSWNISTRYSLYDRSQKLDFCNIQLNRSIVTPLSIEDQAILQDLGQQMQMLGGQALSQEICGEGDTSTKEQRASINGFANIHISDALDLSIGTEFFRVLAESETYFQGKASRSSIQLSANLKYNQDGLAINSATMAEYDDYLNKFITYDDDLYGNLSILFYLQ